MRVCEVENCDRPEKTRLFCNTHYQRFRKHGDPQAHIPVRRWARHDGCKVSGCENDHDARGLCKQHYAPVRNYGIPAEEVPKILEDPECAACGAIEELCFDHDHDTGEFRALLCRTCNTALGFLDEDPKRIEALKNYAKDHCCG